MKKLLFIFLFCPLFINAQIMTTIAGNGIAGYSGDGSPATNAQIYDPSGVAVDLNGNVYISDFNNNRIRKIDVLTGIITTVAGNGDTCSRTRLIISGVPATNISIQQPSFVKVDDTGNIYTACGEGYLIKINTSGIANTIANVSSEDIAIDKSGNIYITDGYATIYKRNASTGVISTIAGNGTLGFTGDGGPATAALLDYAYGIAIDSSANIYIAGGDCRVRKIDMLTGMISTIAGYARSCGYSGDGYPATMSELNSPQGLVIDENNNIYIADYGNSVIRKINAITGIINTIAGNGRAGYFGDGLPAILSQLYFPTRVAVDGSGNIYISDFANNRIRKINNISSSVNGLKTSEFSINIFPNPASTECTITFTGTLSNKANISIYDITGRLMLSQPLTSANTTISITALPPGLYQCRVSDGETTITKKLVVMR